MRYLNLCLTDHQKALKISEIKRKLVNDTKFLMHLNMFIIFNMTHRTIGSLLIV